MGGKVVQLDEGYTVTEKDGATVAKHAIISQRNTVTVTFDLNYDGSESITVEVPVGGSIEEFPEVQRGEGADRWVLLGWYTEPARGINVGRVGTQITGETTFDEDTVVYAHWRLPGDVNGDGEVDNRDVTRLIRCLNYTGVEAVEANMDTNGDKKLDSGDVAQLIRFIKYQDVDLH